MSTLSTDHRHAEPQPGTRRQLDPAHSTVEFGARHFWGLVTIRGRFDRFEGWWDEAAQRIELTIDAGSVDTGNARRDKHLRSADFFDVDEHPQVRFTSTRVVDGGGGRLLRVAGDLEAAGKRIPLAFDALVRDSGGTLELEVSTTADHRQLGMLWSPLGALRPRSSLHVKARLREV
jgi:polyisoprenoid-binding protein YceI